MALFLIPHGSFLVTIGYFSLENPIIVNRVIIMTVFDDFSKTK
jgi:hypothetical protein